MDYKSKENLLLSLIIILGLVIMINQLLIFNNIAVTGLILTPVGNNIVSETDVLPKGTPTVYGAELGIKYDDVSVTNPGKADQTIYKLAQYDLNIILEGKDLERYINIVSKISCEYCCGASSIIFSDGQAACGCAHSYAMRGLAKYLIKNHPNEFTDDEILEELGKWKTLFFPQQLAAKAQILKSNNIELNYINLASNKYRDIESGVTGNMVGGC